MALICTCIKSFTSYLHGGAQAWQHYRWGLVRAEQRGTITSLLPAASPFLMQPRMQLAIGAARTHCWLTKKLLIHQDHSCYSTGMLSTSTSSSLYMYQKLPQPMERPCRSGTWSEAAAQEEEPTMEQEGWGSCYLLRSMLKQCLKCGLCGTDPLKELQPVGNPHSFS